MELFRSSFGTLFSRSAGQTDLKVKSLKIACETDETQREEQESNLLAFQKHPQRQYSSIRSMHVTILQPRDATPIDYYFLCVLQLTMKIVIQTF